MKKLLSSALAVLSFALITGTGHAQSVFVSRMWHNHQPTYWPEWNGNGDQNSRVEYAWDSIVRKPQRSYPGSIAQHPENNLSDIFGVDDRKNSYQSGPRNSLANLNSAAGFCLSYSGSLMDGVRSLGAANQLGYGSGWWNGNREARNWLTPSGSRRLDLVGFTYHHSLAPLLPKAVLRKELQTFKQAYWKAWNGNPNLSDHSKGFFPTEMAFSTSIIDVLAEEGYQWSIVASHHLSRTCPTYLNQGNAANNRGIFSSMPNKADLLGPSPTTGWWYGEPNPGNAAWNVSPFAYQLHRAKYVNPATGAESSIILVPSDDVLSYRFGYAQEGIQKIQDHIAPFANDANRPVIVMPSSDGDNAWGGGSSSWFEATPAFFNAAGGAGYGQTAIQDLVNQKPPPPGQYAHIEDGAWIFPETCYGSPYFLKWIEPPLAATPATRYAGTMADLETPGFALKFWAWAPVITGANWCETAEQILRDEGGDVQAWKIQAPYDWNGSWTAPNDVELAWHIYLHGLDSGFNYYGGLGNDDEVKAALATTRAIQKLQPWMTQTRRDNDRTAPSVLKPQRYPYNPGATNFGWFNRNPPSDNSYLKTLPSEFYVWTHAYDLSGVAAVQLKVRFDNDGTNTMSNNQNETYAGGADVGAWVSLPMTKRALPNTQAALNAAANNGQINYFVTPPELADYYFAKITNTNLPNFRGKLIDYYVEATDNRGNVHRSDIQHVWVEDDNNPNPGDPEPPTEPVTTSPAAPTDCAPVTITYNPTGRVLASAPQVYIHIGRNGWQNRVTPRPAMTFQDGAWTHTYTPLAGTTVMDIAFTSAPEGGTGVWDNNGGADWHIATTLCGTQDPPDTPANLSATPASPTLVNLDWDDSAGAISYTVYRDGVAATTTSASNWADAGRTPGTTYSYTVSATNGSGESPQSADAGATTPLGVASTLPAAPTDCAPVTIRYFAAGRPLSGASQVYIHLGRDGWTDRVTPRPAMTLSGGAWTYTFTPAAGTTVIDAVFTSAPEGGSGLWDNNGAADWHFPVTPCDITQPPAPPTGLTATAADSTSVNLDWDDTPFATAYVVYRDGAQVATPADSNWFDSGRSPATPYAYRVAATNLVGASAQSAPVSVTTPPAGGNPEPIPFVMDGLADHAGYQLAAPGMTLYAALRGSVLYVATWAPSTVIGNDHFLLIGNDTLGAPTSVPPWGKAGGTAAPTASPFLAAESSNSYINWFNTREAATAAARALGQQMEGTIDVSAAFGGSMPTNLYLSALAYQTADSGVLAAQAPAAVVNNGLLEASEFFRIPLEALRDEDANGTYDRLESTGTFRITRLVQPGGSASVRWNVFPGRAYKLQTNTVLGPTGWVDVPGSELTAGPVDLDLLHTFNLPSGENRVYVRAVLVP